MSESTAWQPIETAPQDGTHILVFCADGYRGHWRACWVDEEYLNPGTIDGEPIEVMPTHWMPLPSPPPENVHGR